MKVIRRFDQYRRDLRIDLECEGCGAKELNCSAYDDRNFWDNVIPDKKCENCGKSTKDLGGEAEIMPTRYPEGMQV
jgi:hypothetical protein